MKVANSKLIKLEDLQRVEMYRDYLARLARERQLDKQATGREKKGLGDRG